MAGYFPEAIISQIGLVLFPLCILLKASTLDTFTFKFTISKQCEAGIVTPLAFPFVKLAPAHAARSPSPVQSTYTFAL